MYTAVARITGFRGRWMKTGQGPSQSLKTQFLPLIQALPVLYNQRGLLFIYLFMFYLRFMFYLSTVST